MFFGQDKQSQYVRTRGLTRPFPGPPSSHHECSCLEGVDLRRISTGLPDPVTPPTWVAVVTPSSGSTWATADGLEPVYWTGGTQSPTNVVPLVSCVGHPDNTPNLLS